MKVGGKTGLEGIYEAGELVATKLSADVPSSAELRAVCQEHRKLLKRIQILSYGMLPPFVGEPSVRDVLDSIKRELELVYYMRPVEQVVQELEYEFLSRGFIERDESEEDDEDD